MERNIAGFKAKIAATGITWQWNYYWSSTVNDSNPSNAWSVRVRLNDSRAIATFSGYDDTYEEYLVLGCLAF